MREHLIFYDATCPFCQSSIATIQKIDKKKVFEFFPLESELARDLLPKKLFSENTMILLENRERLWIRGRGAFRILWLIGGKWKLLGWLCFLPFGVDACYRLIARLRHHL